MLRLEPIDLVGNLRHAHGMTVTDLLARVFDELPAEAPRPLGSLVNREAAP